MDSLGCYGNLPLVTNSNTLSSPWSNYNDEPQRSHEDIFSQQFSSMVSQHISPSNLNSNVLNRTYNNMLLGSLSLPMPDFALNMSKATASLDSLDCLLSATNSINTDTSVEDDGISIILSPPQHASAASLETTKKPPFSTKRTHDQLSQVPSFEVAENSKYPKRPRPERPPLNSSNISFQQPSNSPVSSEELDSEAIQQMKEMIYRAAAFRPVNFGAEVVEKPRRKNVKISSDPQTVAARQRRERISERIRLLQHIVPGGNKMDTASMLDEAANYLKFLRSQVKALESFTSGQNGYKLDQHHLVNFDNHRLVTQGLINTYSFFPMQTPFSHQTNPSPFHQAND